MKTDDDWRYSIVDSKTNSTPQPLDAFTCCGVSKCCNLFPFQFVNWIAAILHLGSTIAMIIIYTNLGEAVEYPYTETYITWRRSPKIGNVTACIGDKVEIETRNDGTFCIGAETSTIDGAGIDLGILIISFHALSFVFQTCAGLSEFCPLSLSFLGFPNLRFKYTDEIAKGRNLLRFVEYAFSASIMLIGIALLNGVTDINLVASIAVLTSATQLCGLVAEFLLSEDSDHHNSLFESALVLHITGWLQFFCAYGIIFHAFFRSATAVEDARPPQFVYFIVWIIFALYGVFGIVQLTEFLCFKCPCKMFDDSPQLRNADKKRINYQCKEMSYVTLSLTSKFFLGWMIFSNVMFRSEATS